MTKQLRLPVVLGILLVALIALLAIYALQRSPSTRESSSVPIPLPTPPVVPLSQIDTLLPPDSIRAIDNPQFEAASRAQDIAADERLIAININGDARAFPLAILSSHEIVNDIVGGESVAVTWCPLCYSALVFSRDLDDQQLSFAVSGKLLQNSLIMFDRQTNSLWSQLYGGAIDGPLNGRALSVFPSLLTTWEAWLVQNPQGQVLSKRQTCAQFDCGTYASNPRGSYAVDPYSSYYASSDEGVVNRQIPRDEFAARPKERVFGVRVNGAARAYPLDLLAAERVINDEIAGIPVLIWFDPRSQTGAAYQRQVKGRTLTFEQDPQDPTLIRDIADHNRWIGASGQEKEGRQTPLTPLISTPAFEFGWYNYFPHSDTYSASS